MVGDKTMRVSNKRVAEAQQIIDICHNGTYTAMLNGKLKQVNLDEIKPARFVSSEILDKLKSNISKSSDEKPKIVLTNNSVVDDIIHTCYNSLDSKVGILNFASSYNPGGGFIKGALAQEEALCYASTLYVQLEACHTLYKLNRESDLDTYTDNMGVSETQFIKNGNNMWLPNPYTVKVITSAAVNNRKVKDPNSQRVKSIMKVRMHKIIELAIYENIDILILGAFGCGVFKNDPKFIAETWRDELSLYGGYFKQVIFSVMGDTSSQNYLAFSSVFKGGAIK